MAEPGDGTLDLTTPEAVAAIKVAANEIADSLYNDRVSGLTKNRDTILGEKKELETRFAALEDELKKFDELGDLDGIRQLVSVLKSSEEAQLIKDGKFDEVIANRTTVMRSEYDQKITAFEGKVKELEGTSTGWEDKFKGKLLDISIRDAATKGEVLPEAVAYAITRGLEIFSLDENERIVALDEKGGIIMGVDGTNPMTPSEWISTDLRKDSAFMFPAVQGSGTPPGGGQPNQPGGKFTISKADLKKDFPRFKRMHAEAEKAGQEVFIHD